ncbi:MAG: phosphatase PAP2 family protein [Terracidiphilus sp.]
MRLLNILLSPPVLGVIALFLSAIWMLRDTKDKTRPLLVFALVLNLFYGFLLTTLMSGEGGLFPWKFDHILFCVDQSLGIQAAAIARPLQGFMRVPLWVVYQLMVPMMIVWFLVTSYRKLRASVVLAYVAELVTGPLLYALFPACGPLYAFGKHWLSPPAVQPVAIRLAGMPNAFPSLHVGTAFLFLLLAPGKLWKAVAFAFLALTCLATISTGEHYVIDLIPGLAFGAFAAAVGSRDLKQASLFLSTVLAWSLAMRFASFILIAHPFVTRSFAALTIALAIYALWKQWRAQSSPAHD